MPSSSDQVSPGAPSLDQLARKHATDKGDGHAYAPHYERQFAHLRNEAIVLLEIGTGGYRDPLAGGESLRMWKEFFPRGRIVGLDIYDKSALMEERIEIVQGSQDDPGVLNSLAERYGPFDIVVDDGSHYCAHVIASFRLLFGHLKENGIYAIEDLQTSYWRRYGGNPTGTGRGTSMRFLFGLANGLNYEEFDVPGYRPSRFDQAIESVTFYHNLAIIQKGENREGSNLLPPHPRERRAYGVLTRPAGYLAQLANQGRPVGRALRLGLEMERRLLKRIKDR